MGAPARVMGARGGWREGGGEGARGEGRRGDQEASFGVTERLKCEQQHRKSGRHVSSGRPLKTHFASPHCSQLYFDAWLGSVRAIAAQRQRGAATLAAMEAKRGRERLHNAFRWEGTGRLGQQGTLRSITWLPYTTSVVLLPIVLYEAVYHFQGLHFEVGAARPEVEHLSPRHASPCADT